MKNYKDLLVAYNAMVDEIQGMTETHTEEEIINKLAELETLKNSVKLAKKIEDTKKLEIANDTKIEIKGDVKMENKRVSEILAKLITGRASAEEREEYLNFTGQVEGTDTKGGYLVPTEFIAKLHEHKRSLPSLEDLVTKIPVKTNKGVMPIADNKPTSKMTKLGEGVKASVSEESFSQLSYTVDKYVDVMAVSEELMADAAFNVEDLIKMRIAKKSVRTNNDCVVTELKKKTSPLEATKTKLLEKLEEAIYNLDPLHRDSTIVTSTEGVKALATLKDNDGRYLLIPDPLNPYVKKFLGFTVFELPNVVLPKVETNKVEFFVGDLSQYLVKFDRETLEFSKSNEAGFLEGSIYIRAMERFTYKVLDSEAIQYVKWANA
ncbi:phage major capsid protein [Streptobacillus canis]|uniref:phage major capsid protein n=1 Tax=Streptobacillus canis TaxID=2678686 RepID=UPI0012E283DB|nr:phage major capsid protein [Streptobacillus canis]